MNKFETVYLGKWRNCQLYFEYSNDNGEAHFYTYINEAKFIIKNNQIISVLFDTSCYEQIEKIILKIAKDYNNIEHLGQRGFVQYWLLSDLGFDDELTKVTVYSFDGSKIEEIKSEEDKKELLDFFTRFSW